MKCPKCGYNSFEFLDSCKKCNTDLSSVKESLGIRSFLAMRKTEPGAPSAEASAPEVPAEPIFETPGEIAVESGMVQPLTEVKESAPQEPEPFSFDELLSTGELPLARAETPQKPEEFSFEEFDFTAAAKEPAASREAPAAEEKKDLLEGFEWESTTQDQAPAKDAAQPSPAPTGAFAAGAPEEFDLSSFSFEEPDTSKKPQKPTEPPAEKSRVVSDLDNEDFKSMFEEDSEEK
jgi:hypothetical protein